MLSQGPRARQGRVRRLPALALLLAVGACGGGAAPALPAPRGEVAGTSASPSPSTPADPVSQQLAAMSLDAKVGQVFMPYAYGSSATTTDPVARRANHTLLGVDTAAELIARYHVGGLVVLDHQTLDPRMPTLSTHTVDSPTTVSTFASTAQQAARAAGDPILLVGTDQEGGAVTRLGPPYAQFPSARTIAAGPDPAATVTRQFRELAAELTSTGVNVDFAPVADVNSNPRNPVIGSRAFGTEPQIVTPLVAAAVRACAATALACVAKHYPGHGSTSVDSHVALPTVTKDLATLERVDLPPFAAAVAAGVPMIMVGHLLVPALDPDTPASLSPRALSYLRQRLGFTGVIVTDGLFMGALRQRYADPDIAVRALAAGADLLLEPPDLPGAVAAVTAAIGDGRLPLARLDDAVRRILTLKHRLPAPPIAVVATPARAHG